MNVPLSDLMVGSRLDLYPEVQGKDYFGIHLSGDRLVFQARGIIGLIPINDAVAIDIRPRLPVENLERLLSVSGVAPISLSRYPRRYSAHEIQPGSLLDVLAQALIESLSDIEVSGLFRQYIERLEDTSFPRGRILFNQTMLRHEAHGLRYRVTGSWFESSLDNAPNRCLKYAIWSLAQRYSSIKLDGARRRILAELNRVYHLFRSVTLDGARGFLRDVLVADPERLPSIRAYYRDPVQLATAIAQNQGVVLAGPRGAILLATLLLSLQEIFEVYLREVLKSSFRTLNPTLEVLDGNKAGAGGGRKPLFDGEPSDFATPDIVVRDAGRRGSSEAYPVIVDVKYKKITSRPDRNDVNQVIAYGASYRAPKVVLVHPLAEGARHGLLPLGRIGPLAIYDYGFDLAAGELAEEERVFSESMFKLAGASAQGAGPAA